MNFFILNSIATKAQPVSQPSEYAVAIRKFFAWLFNRK